MSTETKQLIGTAVELTSLPAVVMQAVQLLNQPCTSASDIGNVIAEDPALTARLLKIVNSAFYGFPSRIETISRAITIVGTRELTDLILGTGTIQAFEKIPNNLVNMEKFWAHSLYTGVVARILARRIHAPNTERYFVMGLLHDIGSLVLYRHQPDRSRQALELAAQESLPLHIAEQRVFEFDHTDVGAELMCAWNLPDSFVATTRHHHRPSAAELCGFEAALVHLADVISGTAQGTASGTSQTSPLEGGAWELTGLSVDIVEPVIAAADRQFEDARAAILPHFKVA